MDLSPRFHKEVATVAGSPALTLFARALMDLASSSSAIAHIYGDAERRRLTVRNHEAIAGAIAEGKPALAAERMQEHLDVIWRWTDSTILGEPL
jgi:DNA-binding GntR family transcriptional regulator